MCCIAYTVSDSKNIYITFFMRITTRTTTEKDKSINFIKCLDFLCLAKKLRNKPLML